MESILQDTRFALRTLAKHPIHTFVIILTLALGIGANTAIFSVIDGVLLDPLPYARGESIVRIRQEAPLAGVQNLGFSVPEVLDYRQRSRSLEAVVEYHSMPFTFLGASEPERLQTGVVSAPAPGSAPMTVPVSDETSTRNLYRQMMAKVFRIETLSPATFCCCVLSVP